MIFLSILILIVAIALPSINKNIASILYLRISSIIFIYAGVLSFNALYIQSIGSGIGIYSGLFHVTLISQFLDTFIFIIGSLILVSWPLINNSYLINSTGKIELKEQLRTSAEYSLIVLFSSLGATLLISSSDLISMYLSIELQSFGVYILSTLYRDSESATSAGLKYFLLGGLSSCLILLGAGLVYSYTGLTNFESIYSLVSVYGTSGDINMSSINQGLSLGLILIMVGFLFKISAAPLHNWAPDVYDDSPTIITIWLTIMPKISIIIFLLELYVNISFTSSILDIVYENMALDARNILQNLLLISSLLSLIIGTIVGLAQSRIKRLLAYSTISHIGFMLLALAISTEQSIDSLIFYIIQYSITNLNTFLILLALGYLIKNSLNNSETSTAKTMLSVQDSDIKFISELKGQFYSNPLLTLSLTICLLSMAGIPPLMGFFSKQFVLYSAIQNGYYFMAILAIVVSVISASYYLKIIRILHSSDMAAVKLIRNESNFNELNNKEITDKNLTNFHSFIISTLTLSILLFVLNPSILLNSTQLLSLSLFNT